MHASGHPNSPIIYCHYDTMMNRSLGHIHWVLTNILLVSVALLLASKAYDASAEQTRIVLHNRNLIQGQLLLNDTDRVVVDLGFTAINIPMDRIKTIAKITAKPALLDAGKLYKINANARDRSVSENVTTLSEAVLQIRTPVGLGSGFLIHQDGYVLTNHHVIADEHRITITMFANSARELRRVLFENVRIVAMNPNADLALLKIEEYKGAPFGLLTLGDPTELSQGETVFSIGSPLGFDRTVSKGIVSLKNRPIDGRLYIQSTVQINPGNSGGPLFNLKGEVIGMTNMKIASIGIEGLNFAIPSDQLKYFLDNADAFAFDPRHPNAGYRYNAPPVP